MIFEHPGTNTRFEQIYLISVGLCSSNHRLANSEMCKRFRSSHNLAIEVKTGWLMVAPWLEQISWQRAQGFVAINRHYHANSAMKCRCQRKSRLGDQDDHDHDAIDDAIKSQKSGLLFSCCRAVPTGVSHASCMCRTRGEWETLVTTLMPEVFVFAFRGGWSSLGF